MPDRPTNPLNDLRVKLRRDLDHRAELERRNRQLAELHAVNRDEIAELDAAIGATRGLLALADAATAAAAKQQRATPANNTKPVKGTK